MTAGKFLQERLKQYLVGLLTKRYRKLKYEELIFHVPDLEAGAAEVVRDRAEDVGEAAIIGDGVIDIPVVDLGMDQDNYRVVAIATSIPYTMLEMRAMEKAGNADMINARKLAIANRAIEEKDNKFAFYGSTALGVKGFLNQGSVTLNNSSSLDIYDGATTAKEMYEIILDTLSTIVDDTDGAEIPSDLAVPVSVGRRWKTVTVSDNADRSVYEYLLANGITSITEVPECKSSRLEANGVHTAGTDKDRIVFYPKEMMSPQLDEGMDYFPEVIERHVEPTQVAPEEYHEVRNMKRWIPVFKCGTPTIVNYPSAMYYMDLAKKS